MFETLNLSELPKKSHGMLRSPSSTRPAIWGVEENGARAVVKDFSVNGFLFRNTVGRFLIWRENKAYRRLKGIKGIPTLYRVISGLALVIEEIPGRNMENPDVQNRPPKTFFYALKDLVDTCHQRGIAHCDLKRAANTIQGTDGFPYIIDWGASISRSEFRISPLNVIYRKFVWDDYLAIIKMKLNHIPEAVTQEEKKRYNNRSTAERLIRPFRDRLRELLQKVA